MENTTQMMHSNETETLTAPHELNDGWCLYSHNPTDTQWTIQSYLHVDTMKHVEHVVQLLDKIPDNVISNYMFFFMRKGIQPIWEAPQNQHGGGFSYKVQAKYIPQVWKKICYLASGETIMKNQEHQKKVTGITISPKKYFCIIKIWLTDCTLQDPQCVNYFEGFKADGCLFKKHAKT